MPISLTQRRNVLEGEPLAGTGESAYWCHWNVSFPLGAFVLEFFLLSEFRGERDRGEGVVFFLSRKFSRSLDVRHCEFTVT